jgi:hypothetical protein
MYDDFTSEVSQGSIKFQSLAVFVAKQTRFCCGGGPSHPNFRSSLHSNADDINGVLARAEKFFKINFFESDC